MRRLELHSSALSDDEYQYFTTSFSQIALDDVHDDFEDHSLRIREARAWLRGRYSHLPAHRIDEV